MTLFNAIMKVGDKLGVVKIVSTTAQARPGKIPTRKVTLKELATEIHGEEIRKLSELPAELSVDFAKVFEAAGIKPPASGWTIDRLQKVLASPQYQNMERQAVQTALLNLLTIEKAHVHELVQDAMARDKALDSFEEFARKKMDERSALRQSRIDELESQVRALKDQIGRLEQERQADKDQWKKWHDKKIQCEKNLAAAVSFLVADSVITVDNDHE